LIFKNVLKKKGDLTLFLGLFWPNLLTRAIAWCVNFNDWLEKKFDLFFGKGPFVENRVNFFL